MSTGRDDSQQVEGLGGAAVVAVLSVLASWGLAAAQTLIRSGETPRLSIPEAGAAVLRLLAGGRAADPGSAYPPATQELMFASTGWWIVAGAYVLVIGGVGWLLVVRLEPLAAKARLGRRPLDLRGSRPRSWARPRDLITDPAAGGFGVGRLDGRQVFTDEQSHIAVIAPTRAGKTTRCVVPWLLEHEGPAIVTSTKRDVLQLAGEACRERGKVWIFDPFSVDSSRWTPMVGCHDWAHALRQAQWLVDAAGDGDSETARFWQGESAKLIAPLLHAAALLQADVDLVLRWIDRNEYKPAAKLLNAGGAEAALAQLEGVAALDDRNRGTTYMSAASTLAAYRHPPVIANLAPELTARRFITAGADTLFIVASERHQRLLAPLIVSLISSIVHEATETDAFAGDDRRLRVLLDEAANIAPLRDLPQLLSLAAGHGIRVATIWQSLGQMRGRYGYGADTILANSTAKLFMGSITDEPTRDYVIRLLGEEPNEDDRRPLAATRSLQQAAFGRGLLVAGNALPAVIELPGTVRAPLPVATNERGPCARPKHQ